VRQESPARAPYRFDAAVPILGVADLTKALEYYERVLGFDIAWQWGNPPNLANVCRDRVSMNLSVASGAPAIARVYVQMGGVDAFYERIVAAGATVDVPIGNRPYGMRDFRIVDPDGNELSFGEVNAA
jgi:uncharacterized glyoxalase superfamily protein PhnB